MKAVRLTVCLRDIKCHAQVFMDKIFVSYKECVPQSISDSWQFYMCEYDEERLPDFVEVCNNIDPQSRVGFGMSQEFADEVCTWMKENGFKLNVNGGQDD